MSLSRADGDPGAHGAMHELEDEPALLFTSGGLAPARVAAQRLDHLALLLVAREEVAQRERERQNLVAEVSVLGGGLGEASEQRLALASRGAERAQTEQVVEWIRMDVGRVADCVENLFPFVLKPIDTAHVHPHEHPERVDLHLDVCAVILPDLPLN